MTRRSWLQVVLVVALAVSLLANFFLAGYTFKQSRMRPGADMVAETLAGAYPQEVRSEFRKLLRENRREAFAALRDLRQARRALSEAANATPYRQADVEQAMAGVRAATDALQTRMQELLLEALKNTQPAA